MSAPGFALFDTAVGRCGIAWGKRGVCCVRLPEARATEMRAHLVRRFPEAEESAPPPVVQRAVDRMITLLRGEASDLTQIQLDMDGVPPFHRRVYELARGDPERSDALLRRHRGSARLARFRAGRRPSTGQKPVRDRGAVPSRVGRGRQARRFLGQRWRRRKARMLRIEQAQRSLFDGDGQLGFDPAIAVQALRAADPKLRRLIGRIGPCRLQLKTTPSIFAALAESIVYQQLHGKAAATIFARVRALFPRARGAITAAQILGASEAELRSAGLSNNKYLALRDLAERTKSGSIPSLAQIQKLDDEAIIERLTEVRGIGRWTVEMLLIFRLGRPDVLPLDDFGVRNGYAIAFGTPEMPTKAELEARAKRWQPYRSVASWYLWRATDSL